MVLNSLLELSNKVLLDIDLLLSGLAYCRKRIFQLLSVPILLDFQLEELFFFQFGFLLNSFHFPLHNIFYFQVQGHTVIMDRVENDWVGRSTIITYLNFELLNLFLNEILNYFDTLNDDIFKYSLSLIDVHSIFVCVVSQLGLKVLEKLIVHSVFLIHHGVYITRAYSTS